MTVYSDGHRLFGRVVDSYTRVARVTFVLNENIEYAVNRRWYPICKKSSPPSRPGSARRTPLGQPSAALTSLYMSGLSHGKDTEFRGDAFKCPVSRYTSYRYKMTFSRKLTPEHDHIAGNILSEPSLNCDELWWPVSGGSGGVAMVVLREKACLVMVVESATIERVREMLPDYRGIVVQDSKVIWLHAGIDHRMYMWHQHRLCKKDLKREDLKGNTLRFVSVLDRIDLGQYRADKIPDPHTKGVTARCPDKQRSELMNHSGASNTADRWAAGLRAARIAGLTRMAVRSSANTSKDTAERATFTPPTCTITGFLTERRPSLWLRALDAAST